MVRNFTLNVRSMLYNSKTPQDIALSFWSRHNCCYAVSKLMRFLAEKHLLTKCNEHMYVVFTSFQRRPFLLPCPDGLKINWNAEENIGNNHGALCVSCSTMENEVPLFV